ncbi:hypothetical protein [Nannocystis pusilla]|uniref:hypothetical protein n=1 Tax=Nannocystis pusilla TaxID=889268 RepID=UPI003DA33EA8
MPRRSNLVVVRTPPMPPILHSLGSLFCTIDSLAGIGHSTRESPGCGMLPWRRWFSEIT